MRRAQRGAPPQPDADRPGMDRRTFLVSGVASGAFAGGLGWFVAPALAATEAEAESFRKLSGFLIGVPDPDLVLAGRAYDQLVALDASFAGKADDLAAAVSASGAADMDAFLASPESVGETLRATTVTIVSAWYQGYTGTPIPLRAEDDTGFVTFTEARMFEPTMDATVRPSYARAGTNYWIDPPPFVTVPPAPPGIREWGRASPQGVGEIPEAPDEVPFAPPQGP